MRRGENGMFAADGIFNQRSRFDPNYISANIEAISHLKIKILVQDQGGAEF